ncbi:apolipoprotein N-acyltransferase [Granulicella arctica]|uniref:Apolipoprotein N-acyltransferase n=1 Tax=Granulicella arctica TaxID=940613 RepID=A0A7Y9PJG1_9BACT|nr:apolipoprotein N-acyltransferase [Granulicella arctica]NYF81022.1 apolipoprotein N-acyltransferase [Granulicella arctica]
MRLIPLRLWLLTVLSAILQTLPFPLAGPVPLWRTAFCWVALAPLLLALTGKNSSGEPLTLRQTAILGYLCGILWYLGNCYWIYQTMYLYGGLAKPIAVAILILFSMYLGLYHALFGLILGALRRSRLSVQGALLLSPFAWVAVELARARITGFPWDLLGNTQVDNSLLTRLAPITGVYGLSFVIAAVNALWLIRIRVRERRHTRQLLTLAGVVIVILYLVLLRHIHTPNQVATNNTATLVQENLGVGTESHGNYETSSQLVDSFSKLSVYPSADRCLGIPEAPSTRCIHFLDDRPQGTRPIVATGLIVWPESPAGFRTDDPAFADRLSNLARATSAPLIIGSLGVVPDPDPASARGVRVYDSAALVHADGTSAGRYDKIHLVPWGEYIPFKDFFFFAKKLTAGVGDMDRGTDRTVFRTAGHAYGVFICYESIFGDEVRQFVKNGAEVLINISDDGWYGDTSAAWEHLNMVRMRAIENHRWILRSTNTGVTAAIDPYGHVTDSAPRHIRTALHTGFNFEHDVTFYTIHGDLFAYTCALITVLGLAYSFTRASREK